MSYWLEIIGWSGTLFLLVSYFMRERLWLHYVALLASILKLIYCYHHDVWPLFANWAVLIPVHVWQVWQKGKG